MKTGFIRITRVEDNETQGTFSVLTLNGEAYCVTLEPPERENLAQKSCIPAGQYIARRVDSPKFGKTWEITNVPNRSAVLFHGGNQVTDTLGCVLLAQYFGKLKGNRAVLNSGATFAQFLTDTTDYETLHVTISEAF